MDRSLVYPGQIPLETDQLNQNRATMIAIGKLVAAVLGTGNIVSGLAVAPTSPAGLSVVVAPGEIYSLQNVDGTAYSSLPADTTHACMKQGISLDAVTLACAPPTTSGFSTNFLIEAAFQEVDGAAVVLPYYNASNPTQAFSGPGNSGNAQATLRQGKVVIQAKAGIAASTGTQTTPAVDPGYVAIAVVTVANGQTTITSGNIAAVVSTSVMTASLMDSVNAGAYGRLKNVQVFANSATYTPTAGTKAVYVEVQGGGGSGGGTAGCGASQVSVGNGGAGGGYASSYLTSGFAGMAVVVGSGGASASGNGNPGGASSFGAISASGGGGGGMVNPTSSFPFTLNSPTPGQGSGGNVINAAGGQGIPLLACSLSNYTSGAGGVSRFGSGGRQGVGTTYGNTASSYGAGGGGGSTAPSGSATGSGGGGSGLVIIWEYA